jgi:hypothetical protein
MTGLSFFTSPFGGEVGAQRRVRGPFPRLALCAIHLLPQGERGDHRTFKFKD